MQYITAACQGSMSSAFVASSSPRSLQEGGCELNDRQHQHVRSIPYSQCRRRMGWPACTAKGASCMQPPLLDSIMPRGEIERAAVYTSSASAGSAACGSASASPAAGAVAGSTRWSVKKAMEPESAAATPTSADLCQ